MKINNLDGLGSLYLGPLLHIPALGRVELCTMVIYSVLDLIYMIAGYKAYLLVILAHYLSMR